MAEQTLGGGSPMTVRADGFSPAALWELLASQAEKQPDTVALVTSDSRLTYSELKDLVRSTGSYLLSAWKPKPEQFLPVLVGFSIDSIVNVLACLCYRIPFSPLDPDTPQARQAHLWDMLGRPAFFLAPDDVSHDSLPAECRRIPTDQRLAAFPSADQQSIPSVQDSDDAIVIMTSGSTGTPKGVVLSWDVIDFRLHQASASLAEHQGPGLVTSLSPLHFIGGIRHLGFLLGGRGLFRAQPSEWHPKELLRQIAHVNPTHLSLPAQLARIFGRIAESSDVFLPDVVQVTIGAESIHYEFIAGLQACVPPSVIVRHSLGSTEVSGSFVNSFQLSSAPKAGKVPIGVPIDDGTLRLEPWSNEFPHVAEVWRSGAIASRYIGDPLHNETRFVVDEGGTRWWRSGDLVTRDDDGQFYHFGRADDVVKVKGKLASPAETASALMGLPGVGRTIVLPDSTGNHTVLIAHVEPARGSKLSANLLREELFTLLPEHLVPSRIFLHENLPITPRGKIDRQSLRNFSQGSRAESWGQ